MIEAHELTPNVIIVRTLLSDVKVGKPCRLTLETGQEIETGKVVGWLRNIKGQIFIKTEDEWIGDSIMNQFVGKPGCDEYLRKNRNIR